MNDPHSTYTFSGRLVNGLMVAIFGAQITLLGYMVVWAQRDAGYKADLTRRLIVIERDIAWLQVQTSGGILPLAKQRLETLEERVRANERQIRKHGLEE